LVAVDEVDDDVDGRDAPEINEESAVEDFRAFTIFLWTSWDAGSSCWMVGLSFENQGLRFVGTKVVYRYRMHFPAFATPEDLGIAMQSPL